MAALEGIDQDLSLSLPGPGRRADLERRVERDIRAQLRSGELTMSEFENMILKSIGERFGCGVTTAGKVKKQIIDHSNSRK